MQNFKREFGGVGKKRRREVRVSILREEDKVEVCTGDNSLPWRIRSRIEPAPHDFKRNGEG